MGREKTVDRIALRRRGVVAGALALSALAPGLARAQAFPSRPVRVLVGAPPGSAPDVAMRLMGDRLSALWRQPVVVDNRPAANGNLAAQACATAEGDGHTLLFAQASILVLNEALMRNAGFHAERDFVPISYVMSTPFLLGARPNHPANTVADLVRLGRRGGPGVTFATSSAANLPRFAVELINRAGDSAMQNVPYSTTAGAIQDTIAGRTDIMIDGTPVMTPQVRGGAMKAIAVTSAERFPTLPEVPTVAETYPGFQSVGWFCLVGPRSMLNGLVGRIAADMKGVATMPEIKDRLLRDFATEVVAGDPAEAAAFFAKERATYRALVSDLRISLD